MEILNISSELKGMTHSELKDNLLLFQKLSSINEVVFDDAENYYSFEQYESLLKLLAQIALPNLSIENIKATAENQYWVFSFTINNQASDFQIPSVDSDWFQQAFLNKLNECIFKTGNLKRFRFVNFHGGEFTDQCFQIVFTDNETYFMLMFHEKKFASQSFEQEQIFEKYITFFKDIAGLTPKVPGIKVGNKTHYSFENALFNEGFSLDAVEEYTWGIKTNSEKFKSYVQEKHRIKIQNIEIDGKENSGKAALQILGSIIKDHYKLSFKIGIICYAIVGLIGLAFGKNFFSIKGLLIAPVVLLVVYLLFGVILLVLGYLKISTLSKKHKVANKNKTIGLFNNSMSNN